MKNWELIKRPSGVTLLRFCEEYLLEHGKTLFWALAEDLRKEVLINDVVTGSNEIALFMKANSSLDERLVEQKIKELGDQKNDVKRYELEVSLNGEDLDSCVAFSKISKEQWVQLFLSIEFCVELMGFIPYFSYLEGLPDVLKVPRKSIARTRVPAGSLAIGGGYVGVYPQDTPGGWNLIGECLELAKLKEFRLGDRVKFIQKGGIGARD